MKDDSLTKEQQEDRDQRIKAFDEEYANLCNKYEVDHALFPQWMAVTPGLFATTTRATVRDRKYQSVPSPLQRGDIGGSIIDKS